MMKRDFRTAGAVLGVASAAHTYDEDAWLKTIDVNLHGVFRLGEIREVANLATFQASSESSYMTGQAINVTPGGQLVEL
ncbi:MAG: hypothetical protein JSV31_23885 [Desulfobacterales bacterium]|nr:MAG: hypothetical protein JSV31_23885 [Desulfobacterales bacterium]